MSPADREIRKRGAAIAACLGLLWLFTSAAAHSTFDYLLQSLLYGWPLYVFVAIVLIVLLFVITGNAADASRQKENELSQSDPAGGGRGSGDRLR